MYYGIELDVLAVDQSQTLSSEFSFHGRRKAGHFESFEQTDSPDRGTNIQFPYCGARKFPQSEFAFFLSFAMDSSKMTNRQVK